MMGKMVRDTVRQGSVYLVAQLAASVTNLASIIIYSRIFSPSQYGLLTLALLAVSLLDYVIDTWVMTSITRFFPYYKRKEELDTFYSTMAFCILLTFAIYFAAIMPIYFLYGNYLNSTFQDLLLLIIVLVPLTIGAGVLQINFRIKLRPKSYAALQLCVAILGLLVGLLLVIYFGLGVAGILWGQILVTLVLDATLFATSFSQGSLVRLKSISRSAMKKFLAYGFPLTFANVALWAIIGADRYIIGFFWSQNLVGMYSASWNIANMAISVIVSPLTLVIEPYIINVWESKNRKMAESLLGQLTRLSILLALPIIFGATVLENVLVRILTTPAYYPGAIVIPFVALGAFVYMLCVLSFTGLELANRSLVITLNWMLAAGLSIVLNIFLVPMFGIIASGLVYFISCTFLLVLNVATASRYLKWIVRRRSIINSIIAAIIMSIVVIYIMPMFSGLLIEFIASVLIGAAVYFAVLFILGEFTHQEISEMKKLVK